MSSDPNWLCESQSSPPTITICVPACGDGVLIGTENCDDRNRVSGDGCDELCVVEDGWTSDTTYEMVNGQELV